jgi:hypothetical protein
MRIEILTALSGLIGAIVGGSATVFGIIVQQHYATKRERMKLYEEKLFSAYQTLYKFMNELDETFSPLHGAESDFIDLIEHSYIPTVKPLILFYPKSIRNILNQLESQYMGMKYTDFSSPQSFDEFIREEIVKIDRKLYKLIEKQTDHIIGY